LLVRVGRDAPTIGGSERIDVATDDLDERPGVNNPGDTKRAPEGAATLRQCEASRIGVQMRSPPRPSACRIGREHELVSTTLDRDYPQ
jgi:hypothetical protein